MKNEKFLISLNPKLPILNKNEKKVLSLLIEAASLVLPIYKLQENPKYPGANFYPHDATKEEIEDAAKKDPEILSPFTVVERVGGKLVAIPYHQKYAKYLKPVVDKLNQAAELTESEDFKKLLKVRAKALTEGLYKDALIEWLEMKPYILDISINLVDHFDDKLLRAKASYQAWVGVVDMEQTKKLATFKDLIFSARREAFMPSERVENFGKVGAKMEDAVLLVGLISKTKFVGLNLPSDLKVLENHGAEIVLFKNINRLRVAEQIKPTFERIFSRGFKSGYTEEGLVRGNLSYIALHEISHSYLRYKNAERNLKDLFPVINELAATALGIRVSGSLMLKDQLTSKELESMIVAFICRSFYLTTLTERDGSLSKYAEGGVIFVNYMLENKSVQTVDGMAIPNFMKVFVSIQELSYLLEKLLSSGTRKDAELFIKRFSQAVKIK